MELTENKKVVVERGNKVVYDLGDEIVKVFNEKKPASDIFNEALNLARINETHIPSPKALEVSQLEDGKWALRTKKVQGKTVGQLIAEDPSQLDDLLDKFVDFQIEIHGFRSPLLNRQKDKLTRMIRKVDDLDPMTKYDLLMSLDGKQVSETVCHGDFTLSNVIVTEDGRLAACDWAHASQGAPAADVAMSFMLMCLNRDRALADKYLNLYCKKSGMNMQEVYSWLPIVAAAELSRGRENEAEFLSSWIDVVAWQ